MLLTKLRLYNFKNYEDTRADFGGINCLLGNNGSGKTNLLDAIYYLSFTRSALNPSDSQNIRFGESQFLIKGTFLRKGTEKEVACVYQGQKKTVKEDEQEYQKFSEHVGKYPVVLIAPQDIELIWDGSELRRKFFDTLISQLDKTYLENLIVYANQLKQRNSLLRTFSESGRVDQDLLDSYEQRMVPAAKYIHQGRKEWLVKFLPLFLTHYRFITGQVAEAVSITYKSDLDAMDFGNLLKRNLSRDLLLQRTTSGIHRDDFLFTLNDHELKRVGSQGQQKSFLIALKLAEFQCIAEGKEIKPLLLLDDIFDKLDDHRIHQLIQLVAQGMFGQLFITDARQGRSRDILKQAGIDAKIFLVENGNLKA